MKQWGSELALQVHILPWFIFFQMLLKHKPRAGLWKWTLHLLPPFPPRLTLATYTKSDLCHGPRLLFDASITSQVGSLKQNKMLGEVLFAPLQHRCVWEQQAGRSSSLSWQQSTVPVRHEIGHGCGTFWDLVLIQPVTRAGSHCCLQGAWWSAGQVLENSVFSIKALSTGAGTNWLPLLVVSAMKPKILSYPVSPWSRVLS